MDAVTVWSGDWTITIARTASGSSSPSEPSSSSSSGTRTVRSTSRGPRRCRLDDVAGTWRRSGEDDDDVVGSDRSMRDVAAGSSTRGRLAKHPIAQCGSRALDMGQER